MAEPGMEAVETLGKYEIRQPLGRGAMGTVYEGWDPKIARRVAIKTVRLPDPADSETEEALSRFRREAQAAGRLTHPNIVGVFDYGETSDLAYIVMEFVDGPTLKALLDRQERFALADTVRIMEDLLAGLQFSHERGVVHRDIKPANVMLTSGGQAKIADFGIARVESSSMTQAGALLGTPAYMSPEQFMGQVVDARTDIYSAGVLLYQLLTGERPFEGGMSAIMHKALNTEPPLPSQISVTVPRRFDAVVRRAMAKRPDDRFASARAFATAIRQALSQRSEPPVSEGEATMVAQPPAAGTVPHAATRRSLMPLIAALLLLGAAGGGTWWWLARPPAPAPAVIAAATSPAPGTVATPPIKPPETTPAPVPVVQVPPPQPPPEPVVQPGEQQLAAVGLDTLRRQIARWVSGRICALLGGTLMENGAVTLNGLADRQSIEDLRQGLGSFVTPGHTDWRVDGVDPIFCPALNALSLLTPAFGDAGGPRLGLQMVDGRTRLHDGEPVRVRVVAPAFASRLRVDYIAHDGAVQHLYPQLADPKNRIAADPPRVFAPDEAVRLADPSWTISEPYGTDMIIAVASAEPLFDRPRARNSEPAEAYLHDLRLAIDSLRQRGVRLAGAAITVEALPK